MLGDGSDRASAEDPNQWHRVASLNLLQDDYNPFGGGAIHWNGDGKWKGDGQRKHPLILFNLRCQPKWFHHGITST